jgi:hypothetical protein
MYILVLVAFMVGEEPSVRASPTMYNSYEACVEAAAFAMTEVYYYLPADIKDDVSLVHVCTTIPKDA